MARSDSSRCRKKICRHPNPSNTRAPTHFGHVFTLHYSPQQVREIYTCSPTHGVPTPYPWIDVEKLVETVAPIALEFDITEAAQANCSEKVVPFLSRFRQPFGDMVAGVAAIVSRGVRWPPRLPGLWFSLQHGCARPAGAPAHRHFETRLPRRRSRLVQLRRLPHRDLPHLRGRRARHGPGHAVEQPQPLRIHPLHSRCRRRRALEAGWADPGDAGGWRESRCH